MNKTTNKRLLASIRKQIKDHESAIIELRKVEQTLNDELNEVKGILLSVASKEFGVPNQTLHTWVRRGDIGSEKRGKYILVNRGQVEDLAIQKGYFSYEGI